MQTELSRKQIITRASLIAVLAALPFLPTLMAGFPWDELRALDGASLFIMPAEHYYDRPLAVMVLGWERALFGEWAPGYHIFSILLHMANAALFYHIARRMTGAESPAVLSAALFAIYPVHAETLGLVMGQAMLLGGLLGLSSFLLYLVYARKGINEALVAGALFALVGSLAWQAVLMIPLLVVAHALSMRMERIRLLRTLLAYAAAVFAYIYFFGSTGEIFHSTGLGKDNIGRALFVMGYHVMKLAAPVFVSFAKPLSEDAVVLFALVGALAAGALMWIEGMRREALVLLAMLLLLLPASLAVSFETYLMGWFRHAYLGAAGMALILGAAFARFLKGRWFQAVSAVLLVLFAVSAVHASTAWRNREGLWRAAVINNQYSAMPMLNLAAGVISEGRSEAGRDYLARAVTFRNISRDDMINAMRLYAAIGGAKDEPGLLTALSVQRGQPDALLGLGTMHMELYRKETSGTDTPAAGDSHLMKAVEYFERSVAEKPDEALYQFHLGVVRMESGDMAGAESALFIAFALEPDERKRENIMRALRFVSGIANTVNQPGALPEAAPLNSPSPMPR
jgi:hypothetical protein